MIERRILLVRCLPLSLSPPTSRIHTLTHDRSSLLLLRRFVLFRRLEMLYRECMYGSIRELLLEDCHHESMPRKSCQAFETRTHTQHNIKAGTAAAAAVHNILGVMMMMMMAHTFTCASFRTSASPHLHPSAFNRSHSHHLLLLLLLTRVPVLQDRAPSGDVSALVRPPSSLF